MTDKKTLISLLLMLQLNSFHTNLQTRKHNYMLHVESDDSIACSMEKKQFMWLCNMRYITPIFFFSNNSLKIASGTQINIRITQCDLYEVISYHFNRPT